MLLEQFYSNDKAKKTLVNFLTDGRFPHTILLEGEDGCGKLTFAHMTAAALLCEQPLEQRPCGRCRNCKRVLSDTHPDVSVIGDEDKLKVFTSTGYVSCARMPTSVPMKADTRYTSCATSTI